MRRYFFLLISIILLLFFTLPTILSGRFTFAFDMGRDMLWTRNMVELRKPTLVGPWGSIAGVYFGPMWYYLLAVPYLLTGGDPRGAVLVPLVANISTMIIGWVFLKRNKHLVAANLWSLLYAASPLVISISSFAFHANVIPLAIMLFLIGLYNKNFLGISLSAFMVSLTYHFEPAAGFMMTIFFIGWIVIKKIFLIRWRQLFLAGIIFFFPFAPQVVFELRHNFIQSKALVSYVKGENTSLGGVLPLKERASERVTKLARTASQSFLPLASDPYRWMLLGLFLLSMIYLWRGNRHDRFIKHTVSLVLSFIAFHYLAYTFLFPAELKQWYLTGFVVLYLFPLALLIEYVTRNSQRVRMVTAACVIVLAMRGTNFFERFRRDDSPVALETLLAQENVIDWIYQDAIQQNKPFSVYTYTPPIYDYTSQYLLWWEGTRKYRILPAEFSYMPDETSYLPEKEKFISTGWHPYDARISYLVLEPDAMEFRREGWLGHFAQYSLVRTEEFSSGMRVEIRSL